MQGSGGALLAAGLDGGNTIIFAKGKNETSLQRVSRIGAKDPLIFAKGKNETSLRVVADCVFFAKARDYLRSFTPSLLLSKPNPLRWASVWDGMLDGAFPWAKMKWVAAPSGC